jgi:hypothetical protein
MFVVCTVINVITLYMHGYVVYKNILLKNLSNRLYICHLSENIINLYFAQKCFIYFCINTNGCTQIEQEDMAKIDGISLDSSYILYSFVSIRRAVSQEWTATSRDSFFLIMYTQICMYMIMSANTSCTLCCVPR